MSQFVLGMGGDWWGRCAMDPQTTPTFRPLRSTHRSHGPPTSTPTRTITLNKTAGRTWSSCAPSTSASSTPTVRAHFVLHYFRGGDCRACGVINGPRWTITCMHIYILYIPSIPKHPPTQTTDLFFKPGPGWLWALLSPAGWENTRRARILSQYGRKLVTEMIQVRFWCFGLVFGGLCGLGWVVIWGGGRRMMVDGSTLSFTYFPIHLTSTHPEPNCLLPPTGGGRRGGARG